MQDDAGFYAPLHYQQHWLWLGLMLVVLMVVWYLWLLWPTGKKVPVNHRTTVLDLNALQTACLTHIEATLEDVDAGRLPGRAAHQRLSFLVRNFAAAATGLPVTSMTLEELRHHGLDHLATGIATIYPNEFAPVPIQSVRRSAETARQVVLEWN
ncbi:hypothetical protein SAMN04487912_10367 [Arthrobacter sp. cf158]|uniref:hypothetical protein n=1 Tax=Arthrobacter sp. cf158 TaxID=1761744 RepID=UPI0008999273|nr:hypothetical protein [Arthrobacter sp. cf158]SDW47885.1 hypothetical protein SAMN04487912_10367 [Arthrobacter sp. cf158]